MSKETPQKPTQQVTTLSPGSMQQVKPLDLNEIMRKQASNVIKNMLLTIKELRTENAKLKAELAEAQKKP